MYCIKCGNKLVGNELYCTKCGEKVNSNVEVTVNKKSNSSKKTASIVLGILSLAGTFLIIFAPIAFILSIIGLILAIIANKKEDNVMGIILNSIGLLISLFLSVIIILFFSFAINTSYDAITNYINNLWEEDNYIEDYYNDYTSSF